MFRLFQLLAIAAFWTACQSGTSPTREAEQIFKSVAQQYAPDSREDLFQIHFKEDGSKLVASGETSSPECKQALFLDLAKANLSAIDSIRVLPEESMGTKVWGLVNVSVCNIRALPGHSAEMISQAILGTPVHLLKKSGHWLFIQTPDRYLGWVDDDAIYQTDVEGMDAWRSGKRVIFLPNLGSGFNPETKEAVTDLVAGSILKVVESLKKEIVAGMPDGRRMSLPNESIMDFNLWKEKGLPTAEDLSIFAKTLLGRPYLWGGTSTKGVDCSGFVKTVYFLNGYILARDASLQYLHGNFTDPQMGYASLKAGDLVFFGRKAVGDVPAKATHVGLYLGDGAYINSSGYVRIDSFDSSRKNFSQLRADNWLGGRTILGITGDKGIVRVKNHPWY